MKLECLAWLELQNLTLHYLLIFGYVSLSLNPSGIFLFVSLSLFNGLQFQNNKVRHSKLDTKKT